MGGCATLKPDQASFRPQLLLKNKVFCCSRCIQSSHCSIFKCRKLWKLRSLFLVFVRNVCCSQIQVRFEGSCVSAGALRSSNKQKDLSGLRLQRCPRAPISSRRRVGTQMAGSRASLGWRLPESGSPVTFRSHQESHRRASNERRNMTSSRTPLIASFLLLSEENCSEVYFCFVKEAGSKPFSYPLLKH